MSPVQRTTSNRLQILSELPAHNNIIRCFGYSIQKSAGRASYVKFVKVSDSVFNFADEFTEPEPVLSLTFLQCVSPRCVFHEIL